jgi:hypothetical protein
MKYFVKEIKLYLCLVMYTIGYLVNYETLFKLNWNKRISEVKYNALSIHPLDKLCCECIERNI